MKYVKPHFYDDFHCLAGKCPDTCCAGWEIAIDEEALERYALVKGPLGSRLYHSINWEEGVFKQRRGRCSFLNEKKLCGIYLELGADALCSTCREYPRHVEEFEGVRELSLGMSCPEAARELLCSRQPVHFLEKVTEQKEELWEEFQDFNGKTFDLLVQAREVVFAILRDRNRQIYQRMDDALKLAEELQDCMEMGMDMGQLIQRACLNRSGARRMKESICCLPGIKESRYVKMCRTFTALCGLAPLGEEWPDVLNGAWETLYKGGEAAYNSLCLAFQTEYGYDSPDCADWSLMAENLAVYFVYVYFCGAVYDDWIYSKMALTVFSVCWIQELVMAGWAAARTNADKDSVDIQELGMELTYRFAREIEHCDENLDLLEQWLQENKF